MADVSLDFSRLGISGADIRLYADGATPGSWDISRPESLPGSVGMKARGDLCLWRVATIEWRRPFYREMRFSIKNELPIMKDETWMPDRLGDGLEMTFVPMPDDYSGAVRCAVIRKRLKGAERGVLYIHGFSDYFFQREMVDEFVDHGYSFYAVDLRKYGRSYMPGQKMFQVRDIREYFADIQAGIDRMKADGCGEVVFARPFYRRTFLFAVYATGA